MRACVIFNPAARGLKARHFLGQLQRMATGCTLLSTDSPEDAPRLAASAVADGFDTVLAAGGDGTLNQVLNGLARVPDGFLRARVGVIPLGTVNVFAREFGLSQNPAKAWRGLMGGNEIQIDLPYVAGDGEPPRVYFAQLAGAGLDAAAIERVKWAHKKSLGPLAYVVAGIRAVASKRPRIEVSTPEGSAAGELVMIGNGRRYGGEFQVFPDARADDGLLDVCVFPRTNWFTLLRCAMPLLARRRVPESLVVRLRSARIRLTADTPAMFEVDGELGGPLPVEFGVVPHGLRVLVPKG